MSAGRAPRRTPFGVWSACIHKLAAVWLLAVVVLGLWPVPDKYPWALGFVVLVAYLITAGVKGWLDEIACFTASFAILAGLSLWTFVAWELPEQAIWACLGSFAIPVLSLGTGLRAAGAASDPYYCED